MFATCKRLVVGNMNEKLTLLYKSSRNEFKNDEFPLVESTKDYINELVKFTLTNQQKLVDENFRKQFFANLFTEMTKQGNLSLWNKFQVANQENKVFSFELVLKGIDFAQKKLSEKDLINHLEEPISKLAIEVVKQTTDVQLFCPYHYDPRFEMAREISIYDTRREDLIKIFDSWEEEVCSKHRTYAEDNKSPIYDLYMELKNLEKEDLEERNLESKITLFDSQSNYLYGFPWQGENPLENEQNNGVCQQLEERKKQQLLCSTNSNLTVEGAEKISDYTEALAQFIEENKKNFANPFFRQDFFENFSLYIPFKEKHLLLGRNFQEVSRAFKEFHLENILQQADFNVETYRTPYISRLNHEMKRLAVEVAKKNPNIALFYRYDQQLFKYRAFAVFSNERHEYGRTEELVSFLDDWKDSVAVEENLLVTEENTKFHDLYHNRQEITNQVFFLDNKNRLVFAPWERKHDWTETKKRVLTKADSSTLVSLLTDPPEDKLTQLFDYIEIKKRLMDQISQRCEEGEKALLIDMENHLQKLREKIEPVRTSQSEKELKETLCQLDTLNYNELQSKSLWVKNSLKEESTNQHPNNLVIDGLTNAQAEIQMGINLFLEVEKLIKNSLNYSLQDTCELVRCVEEKIKKLANHPLLKGSSSEILLDDWQEKRRKMKIILQEKEKIKEINQKINQEPLNRGRLRYLEATIEWEMRRMNWDLLPLDQRLVREEWQEVNARVLNRLQSLSDVEAIITTSQQDGAHKEANDCLSENTSSYRESQKIMWSSSENVRHQDSTQRKLSAIMTKNTYSHSETPRGEDSRRANMSPNDGPSKKLSELSELKKQTSKEFFSQSKIKKRGSNESLELL